LVGGLLGFIGGYFAAGGGRPALAPGAGSPAAGDGDRLQDLTRAIEKDSENPRLLTALGNAYYDRENWDRAIEAYERARRKAPADPNLLSDLGASYRNRGEFARAIGYFKKARAADPDHWQSLLNLVLMTAFDTRDASAAERHYQELKRRYPEIPNLERIAEQISRLRAGA
ncbi:MAG TPA: tetratricopeptide repeat protein, partial [Thermoanaerobaculia bacterium]|nr:tetratricopeptide repeat protein [Thermoanaerobaculia bacterium]